MAHAAGIDGGDYMSNMDLPPSSSDEEASDDGENESDDHTGAVIQAIPGQHHAATTVQIDDESARNAWRRAAAF